MKIKSKILTLILTLALLCGLFTMIVANAATPEGGAETSLPFLGFGRGFNNGTDNDYTEANQITFGRSGVVNATDGEQRWRYVATPATLSDGSTTMNPNKSFFTIAAPFSERLQTNTITYFTYEMDVSFENIPAKATLSLNARYQKTSTSDGPTSDGPTNGGFLTFYNSNGKLAILAPDGKTSYAVHFGEMEWVHIAWVVGVNHEDMSKCPATLYVNGEPFYTYDLTSRGFFDSQTVYRTGDLRLEPDKNPANNIPDSTLLLQNYKAYVFRAESDELAAFARGEETMRTAAGTYKQVVYDTSYTYPSTAPTADAQVNGVNYATVIEAIDAAGDAAVTLTAHVTGTTEVTKPCTINTNGYDFSYTTSLAVEKNENVLTFAESDKVVKYIFKIDGTEILTKSYGLGAIPDVTVEGLTFAPDRQHFYVGSSWTVNDSANLTEWTMPTAITEDLLGTTVTVELAGGKNMLASVVYDTTTIYCEDITELTNAIGSIEAATNREIMVTFLRDATDLATINLGSFNNNAGGPNAITYLNLHGHHLSFNGTLLGYKSTYNIFIYSDMPDAVITATDTLTSNYNRNSTVTIGTVVKNGATYPGSYLTVNAGSLGKGGPGNNNTYNYNINGGTYNLSTLFSHYGNKDKAVANIKDAKISFTSSAVHLANATQTATVKVDNSLMLFSKNAKFFTDNMQGSGTVTIGNSGVYGVRILVPSIDGLSVVLDKGTVLTTVPAGNVTTTAGNVLARIHEKNRTETVNATETEFTLRYRVVAEKTTAKLTFVTEADPETNEVLDTKTVVWALGEIPSLYGDFHYYHSNTNPEKVLVPAKWVINNETGDVDFETIGALSAGNYTVKPSDYEEKSVSFTVTDADGIMTDFTEGTEAELHAQTERTEADLTIRVYADYKDVETLIFLRGANMQFDLNGHTFSTQKQQTGFFCAGALNRTVYVYSSRPGAIIEMRHERQTVKDETTGKDVQWGGGYAFASDGSKNNLTVGRTLDGKTFDRTNLTINGTCLIRVQCSTYIIDGVTHNALVGDNVGLIQFLQASGGTLELINSDFTSVTWTSFIAARYGVNNTTINIRDSRLSLNAALTAKHTQAGDVDVNVLIEDSILLTAAPNAAAIEGIPVTLGKGTTTNYFLTNENVQPSDGLTCARISDGLTYADQKMEYEVIPAENAATVTWKHGDLVLMTEAWKKESVPTFAKTDAFGDFYFGAAEAKNSITEDREYQLTLKSKVSKIKGNLTLYSNISFNFYLDDAAITEVTAIIPDADADGQTKSLTLTVSREEDGYRIYRLDGISPKDLTKTFEIRLTLENEDKTYTYAVTTSLATYAKSVLTNTAESEEGKTLVASLIDYVREAALYFKTATEEDAVMQTMKTLLENYGYTRPVWTKGTVHEIEGGELLNGAALNLGNNPGFLFFVGDTVTEVTVSYGNGTATFTGEDIKYYKEKLGVLVDTVHASEFRGTVTVTAKNAEGVTETIEYNLDTYIQGIIDAERLTEAPAYAQALAAYSDAAKAYLERQ